MSPSLFSMKSLLILSLLFVANFVGGGADDTNGDELEPINGKNLKVQTNFGVVSRIGSKYSHGVSLKEKKKKSPKPKKLKKNKNIPIHWELRGFDDVEEPKVPKIKHEIHIKGNHHIPIHGKPPHGAWEKVAHPAVGMPAHPAVGMPTHPAAGLPAHPAVGMPAHPAAGMPPHPIPAHPAAGMPPHPIPAHPVGIPAHGMPVVANPVNDIKGPAEPVVPGVVNPVNDIKGPAEPVVPGVANPGVGAAANVIPVLGNPGVEPVVPGREAIVAETQFPGAWEMTNPNVGVSAMHLQLMPNNKFIMFDATSLGKSAIQLPPNNCRALPKPGDFDCYAHSVEYDVEANKVRVLKVNRDPWCSSGGLAPDGTLVGTGGWADGEKTLRYMNMCDNNCDWRESPILLADSRWYGTHVLLGDGRFIVIGGRRAFNYEFLAPENQPSPGRIDLPFLKDTTDLYENNLYPFVHQTPDGNIFLLANNRAILLDVINNKIVRNYPDIPGGARNYPGSGSAAILLMDLRIENKNFRDMEILVCGGGDPMAFGKAEKETIFLPALDSCGRIKPMDANAQWAMETMPTPRVMGDMLNLPNGEILLINGAKKGASGWQYADEPNFAPVLYNPKKPPGQRFKLLAPSQIARMYHATSAILPDGKILVAGSNTNPAYQFVNVKFPTEVRVEKFSPPYLDPALANLRPIVEKNAVPAKVKYDQWFPITFKVNAPGPVQVEDLMVTIYQPPFTTHGYSMNQRLVALPVNQFAPQGPNTYNVNVQAPGVPTLAPPGYYLLFVNYQGVPSAANWIHLAA